MARFSMQQLLRRNILARNQVLRRKRRQIAQANKEANQNIVYEQTRIKRHELDDIKAERKTRREDWLLGPLAPNRDAGLNKDAYGAMDPERQSLPDVRVHKREKYCNFMAGDRVCVVEGRLRGKIGEIKEVNRDTESVTLLGLNQQDMQLPHHLRENDNSHAIVTLPLPIPFSSVRLVVPLPSDPNDPDSPKKEAIIRSMYGGPPFRERPYGTNIPSHTRYISGLHREIEWPEVEPEYESDEEADTTRNLVEERTYVPDITNLPFPPEAINDIINRNARNRFNYDREEIEKLVMEDVKKSWERRRKLRTPKEELWEIRERKRNEELAGLKVSEETMALIRETQAFNLARGRNSKSGQDKQAEVS